VVTAERLLGRISVAYRLIALVVIVLLVPSPAIAVQVYHNDFDLGIVGSEWSVYPDGAVPSTTTSPLNEQHYLGQFDVYATVLSLSGLPAHTFITAEYDLYIIGSWDGKAGAPDGNDIFTVDNLLDFDNGGHGNIWFFTTFSNTSSNQDYPNGFAVGNSAPPIDGNPPRSNAFSVNTLGYNVSNGGDTIYRLSVTFPHTLSTLKLSFFADVEPDPGHLLSDESWGLDNVTIFAVPTPATMVLLLPGLPLLLRWKLRKRC
jgi:hypothetical protein